MSSKTNCLAVDRSEHSNRAFNWYVKNMHASNDTLVLLHIHQMPQLPTMGLMSGSVSMTDSYREIIRDSINKSKSMMSQYEKMCKESNINHRIVIEDDYHSPGNRICEIAKENNVDTIIMGQRGLGAIKRALLGSTSDYVLHHAHLPVVVVPPPSPVEEQEGCVASDNIQDILT